ncbi:hypothetical protein [Bacillus sp. SM2101]|uniref:hypothetical protein n=1 Tax=Bacillus sp. SM2101 TaxID=2805366 RepID=UPI001BDEA26D|nr:hypothetical protein [Bacillus sp. SM2101]
MELFYHHIFIAYAFYCRYELKQFKKIEADLNKVIEIDENYSIYYYNRLFIYKKLNKHQEAK